MASTYTIRDLQNRFNCSEHTILQWIHSGELRAVNIGVTPGKKKPRWRVTPEALASFEALRTTTPPTPPVRRRRAPVEIDDYVR